ncbi:MAG: J domain-containing protein [Planctomycetes bacterium]|nr:J domain-containing protein [Planctomycetota bacterium]
MAGRTADPGSAGEALAADPLTVLGVSADIGEEELRAAYLQKVKEHPPDRSPAEFERIRDAYEALRDPRRRARARLLAVNPRAPLTSLLDTQPCPRRFVGPALWLAALQEK